MFPPGQQSAHVGFSHLPSAANAENAVMFLGMNPAQQRLQPTQQHGPNSAGSPRVDAHKKRLNSSTPIGSNHHAMLNQHRDYREKQQRDHKPHPQMFQKANAQPHRPSAFTNGHKQSTESPAQLNASSMLLQQHHQQQQQLAAAQNNLAAQLALQQLTAQLRQNPHNYSIAQFQQLLKQTGSPQILRGQQPPASNSPDERRRPSLISNFPSNKDNKSPYGLTAGLPIRSNAASLGLPALMRSAEMTTPPVPNRAQHLLSNMHAAQPTSRVALDGVVKRERLEVRLRLDRATDDNKQLDAQAATINKRKAHLLGQMKSRQEEMEREQVEAAAAEAAAAQLRAQANAEASKRKIPLIDRIALENRAHVEETQVPDRFFPSAAFTHSLAKITENYRRFAPALIRKMTEAKLETQKRRENYTAAYDEKYDVWRRRVEKFEKTPKKIAKDQRNRELFEKIFPEIKREREERERNERHERNSSGEPPPKSKDEKAIERACHIPTFSGDRPALLLQELQQRARRTDAGQCERRHLETFNERVRIHGKNFHVLSHFYWKKTCNDMVKYFYATKSEAKYKVNFPKAKKKVTKTYKPPPMPDFREMFEHLLESSPRPKSLAKVSCIICANDVHVFSKIPEMPPEKEKLRKKLAREQEYRQKMSICAKCYSTYKKSALRCPVGKCPGGKRRFKPSRTLPAEFTELPVEAQCLVVQTLQFHPGTPKVCNNCYKRIQTESVNVREKDIVMAPAYPQTAQPESGKKQPKWTAERIDHLFHAIHEITGLPKHADGEGPEYAGLNYDWDAIAVRAASDDFSPTARQCRLVHAKLRDYWKVRERRGNLEAAARHLRQLFRSSKQEGAMEIEENRVGQPPPAEEPKMEVDVKAEPMDTTELHRPPLLGMSTPRAEAAANSADGRPRSHGGGSLTQGTPLHRDDAAVTSKLTGDPNAAANFANGNSLLSPLLANFVPIARSSTSASPAAAHQAGSQAFAGPNGSGSGPKQLKDEQFEPYIFEELGLPRESSSEAQVYERLNTMSPHSFEELSNRLKLRAQEQEAKKMAEYQEAAAAAAARGDAKPQDGLLNGAPTLADLDFSNELRSHVMAAANIVSTQNQPGALHGDGEKAKQFNADPALTTTTADIQFFDPKGDGLPPRRHTNAVAERPNRKSGIANMMIEHASPADRTSSPMQRGRAQTMQKHHHSQSNRPASVPGSTEVLANRPIKTEPIEPTAAHPLSNAKGKLKTARAPSNNSHRPLNRRPGCQGGGAGGAGDGPPNENPVYESLSDDSSSSSSSDSEKPPEPEHSADRQPTRPRFRRMFTPLTLPHHERERVRIPPCPKHRPNAAPRSAQ
ncbi:hypothetical protein M3Y99_01619900 [Aphelenchoides fujianensis]|nr:hypothetical protein M3Y99_01619900 [Aphelenchoides fujianensis]